jgi:hypothetical protein
VTRDLKLAPLQARAVRSQRYRPSAMAAQRLVSQEQDADAATVQAFLHALDGDRRMPETVLAVADRLID